MMGSKANKLLFSVTQCSTIPIFHYSNGFCVMAKIEIDQERCKGCGLCTIACPKALIKIGEEINRQGYFYVVWEANGQCTGCALCGE
ncbi:MAG: ferredoxin family protein, partial [Desulfobacterales bacterium]|nr:ferredoxin family protein [Desulfobacterales bacterium]